MKANIDLNKLKNALRMKNVYSESNTLNTDKDFKYVLDNSQLNLFLHHPEEWYNFIAECFLNQFDKTHKGYTITQINIVGNEDLNPPDVALVGKIFLGVQAHEL